MSDITFRPAWRKADAELERDAKTFWQSGPGLLSARAADERIHELCALAYRDGCPVGVSTATIEFVPRFRSHMAVYRCAVAGGLRHQPLSWTITDYSREVLEQWSLENPDEKVMGLMAVIQSKVLVTRYPQVFGVVNMTFTGFTPSGFPIRVAWFKHATIPTDWPPRPLAPEQQAQTKPETVGDNSAPKGILWIASYPKSGNTWTRSFLHNLLNILEKDDATPQDINAMNEFTTWDISVAPYEKHLGRPVTECTRAEVAAVRPKVQADIAENTDGLAIIKTHHALVMDRGFSTINFDVTSGAIYIVRNPLDVAISFAHHMGTTVDAAIEDMETADLETAIGETSVYEVYGSWSQHVESWTLKTDRTIYVMRYEDMLADPFKVFGGLARHLLRRPSDEQLQTAIERSSFENLRKQEAESGFKEKPDEAERFFREGKSGQWREGLDRRQIRKIVKRHHVQMARFGYLTDELKHLV
jgi:hypothetical protein